MVPANRVNAGAFRGLAVYEESDRSLLFGREQEHARLLELVGSATESPILITGETGVGKTSLVRAGLLPAASQDQLAVYLECGPDWHVLLWSALSRILDRPPSPDEDPPGILARQVVQRNARLLLVVDHVEQMAWIHDETRQQLRRMLADLRAAIPNALLVFVSDRGYPTALGQLVGGLDPIPDRILEVERLDQQRAAQLLEQMVLAGGGYLESGLPDAISSELCASGPVLPAVLQEVGHAAALNGATSIESFGRFGGAEVLLTLYVELLAQRAGGWRARRALTLLAQQPNPRAVVSLGQIAHSSGLPVPVAAVIVSALQREGLLRAHGAAPPDAALSASTADDTRAAQTCALLHPYLHQQVRDFCAPVQRGRARARVALRRRLQDRQLLRPHELLSVSRYLGAATTALERSKTRRSLQVWAGIAAGLLALPLFVVLGLYVALSGSSYLHTARALASVERVVVRAGNPSLAFAFPLAARFGKVQVDSGIALSSIPPALGARLGARQVAGTLLDRSGSQVPTWLDTLLAPLPPVRRGAWLTLAGHPSGARLMLAAASDSEHRRRATETLALLSGDSPETREALLQCAADSRPAVRRMAVHEARRLGAGGLKVLRQAVGDADSQVRLAALRALRALDPETALSLLAQRLRDVDTRVQAEALAQLAAARTEPGRAFAIIHQATVGGSAPLAPIAQKLDALRRRLLRDNPDSVAGYLTAQLARDGSHTRRVEMLRWLISIADRLKADEIRPIVDRLASDEHVEVRSAAIGLQARFGEPAAVMEQLQRLSRSYGRPRANAAAERQAAAVGLGLIAATGSAVRDRLEILKRLLRDGDPEVRGAAVVALLRIGGLGLSEAVRAIRNGPSDVATTALRALCGGEIDADRRVVTIVLASAWRTRRTDIRAQALGCARSLAAGSERLGRWLADQAAVDKDPVVRQAAADAVALALRDSGAKLIRLARFYLRDRDPTIRAGVARAIAQRPPKQAQFLFPLVERLTTDTDPGVRAASAELLVLSAAEPAQAVKLIGRLLEDREPVVVRAAIRSAGMLAPGPDIESLGRRLALVIASSGTEALRALEALEVARKLRLAAPLQQAAVHSLEQVRAAAIDSLARTAKPSKALEVLESALRESASSLRLAALQALAVQSERLGGPAVRLLWRSTLAQELSERRAAFRALGEVRGSAVPTAVRLLLGAARHRSEERRRMAMRALGDLTPHDPQAASALVEGATDPALDVRTEAQAALSSYLGRFCKPALLWRLLRDSETNSLTRRTMVSALATHGRLHGTTWLASATAKLPPETPVATRTAARLALALAHRTEPPEQIVSWLLGW